MPLPYLLMSVLYAAMAALAAFAYSLFNLGALESFGGLRWLRVHFITLGLLVQVLFGVLPSLLAARAKLPSPPLRWEVWLAVNAGLLVLLAGIPLINSALIATGGTLIFVAALLLMAQLRGLRSATGEGGAPPVRGGWLFYLTGLACLLLGIFLGTGLWLRWGELLTIARPKETHIHANIWGFMAMTFAGLLVDFYPQIAGRPLAWPRSIVPIWVLMNLAALGLLAGPWLANAVPQELGMVMLVVATVWLLLNIVLPVRADRAVRTAGWWQLVTAYAWLFAPIFGAVGIVLNPVAVPVDELESTLPQTLVYGWILQFGMAMLPYLAMRLLRPAQPARLGGSWLNLVLVHAGAALVWLSLVAGEYQGSVQGVAFGLWTIALAGTALELWRIVRGALDDAMPAVSVA